MDVVVADVPPKYGMLLSRSWRGKLQGTMQMDGAYATIPVFSQLRRLYREAQIKFLVSSPEKPENSPLYSVHTDLDSFILFNDGSSEEPKLENRDTNNEVMPIDFNIMASLTSEENKDEICGQCTENKILSQQETKYEQLARHSSQTHTPHEERNYP